jgi:hypothetical protein
MEISTDAVLSSFCSALACSLATHYGEVKRATFLQEKQNALLSLLFWRLAFGVGALAVTIYDVITAIRIEVLGY